MIAMLSRVMAAAVAGCAALILAPVAAADDAATQTCRAVMAMGATPDSYVLTLLQIHPDMTYNQAYSLIQRAFNSVLYHQNPLCNDVTIPPNY